VHEYVNDPEEFAAALNLASRFADELLTAHTNFARVYVEHGG
jgi:hypothetical protein